VGRPLQRAGLLGGAVCLGGGWHAATGDRGRHRQLHHRECDGVGGGGGARRSQRDGVRSRSRPPCIADGALGGAGPRGGVVVWPWGSAATEGGFRVGGGPRPLAEGVGAPRGRGLPTEGGPRRDPRPLGGMGVGRADTGRGLVSVILRGLGVDHLELEFGIGGLEVDVLVIRS
jgi:hypothetical protein